ncbi:MAG: 4Fe-4S binding protein [Desulfatitalea sp.]|nr:ATP-binding protein [Desulfatitalea sp.]NNK01643.1 4Fe-4S binding protein [Desulfatitalea sp.]
MHEVVVISGKGGTGKTSLTAAFAHLSRETLLCDLDVDAPDLHLILNPSPSPAEPFFSGFEPQIDRQTCTACGTCAQMCRFDAIAEREGKPWVDLIRCEGCGVCVHFCPERAIAFSPKQCGQWRISQTRFGPMVHAQLYPGEENSGKLVAHLRKEARQLAESSGLRLILSDGPPGIGCPVISALSGVDLAVMVTEPTPSGLHDLKRVVELSDHFKVPAAVIINKSDLNASMADDISSFCASRGIPVPTRLPHDTGFVHAMVQGRTITEHEDGVTSRHLRSAWADILKTLHAVKAA